MSEAGEEIKESHLTQLNALESLGQPGNYPR